MPPPMSRVGRCSHPVRGCRTKLGVDARDGGNFQRPSRLPRTRDHGVRSRAPARGRLCDFHTAEGVPTASSRSGSRRRALPKRLRRTTPEHVGRLPMSIPSTGAGWALGRRGKVSRRTRCTRSSGEDPMLNSASRGGAMIVALAAAAACSSRAAATRRRPARGRRRTRRPPRPARSTSRSRRRSPRPSSRRARSRSPPTRATRRTSSSARTARPSRAWTPTSPRRSPA